MIRTRMHSGRVTAAVAVLLCSAHAATARDLPSTAPISSWTAIATPIPRSALLSAVDLDPGLSRTLTLVQVVRRLHEDDTRRGTLRARLIAALAAAGEGPGRVRGTREARQDAAAVLTAAGTGTPASAREGDNMVPLGIVHHQAAQRTRRRGSRDPDRPRGGLDVCGAREHRHRHPVVPCG